MADFDKEHRGGRNREDLGKALVSGRVGPSGLRTFHCNFGSVKIAGKSSTSGAIAYLKREGEYDDRDDLEFVAGDADQVESDCQLIEKTARIRKGSNAERILITSVFELPDAFDQVQREAIANLVVADWKTRGHNAVAAVHANNKVQPHLHLAVAARPVVDGVVDRSVRLMVGKSAIRAERTIVARQINQILGHEFFHGGTHRDVGIDRKPKKRLPESVYRRQIANPYSEHEKALYALQKAEERRAREHKIKFEKATARRVWLQKRKTAAEHFVLTSSHVAERQADQLRRRGDRLEAELKEAKAIAGRPSDELPATYKQIKYLEDLVRQTNSPMPEDFIMLRGKVGQVIKGLEKEIQNTKTSPAPNKQQPPHKKKYRGPER